MLRSRVTKGLDVTRLANAVSRPGIDPRIWVSYAVLQTEPFVDERPGKQGVFADVRLLPSGVMDTARVGAIYAGNGFGLYAPLHKDDEVLVCAPSGDPDEGLVIVQRLWSTSDPQPAQVAQTPEDVMLVVEPDKNLRLTVQGSGNVYMTVDAGKIYLGSPENTEPVALGTQVQRYLDRLQPFFTGFNVWAPVPTDGGAALKAAVQTAYSAAGTTLPTTVPNVEAATTEVK